MAYEELQSKSTLRASARKSHDVLTHAGEATRAKRYALACMLSGTGAAGWRRRRRKRSLIVALPKAFRLSFAAFRKGEATAV